MPIQSAPLLLPTPRAGLFAWARRLGPAVGLVLLLIGQTSVAQETPSLEASILKAEAHLAANPADQTMRWYLVRLYFTQGAREADTGNGPGAVRDFTQALRVVQDGGVRMITSEETFRAADVALAHAVTKLGKDAESLDRLDEIIATLPGLNRAVNALGAALMRSSDAARFRRGLDLLGSLKDVPDAEVRRRAAATAAALAYDRALVEFRTGSAEAARAALLKVRAYFGERPLPSDAQNQNFRFALAKAHDESGDTKGALQEYETLYAENPQYTLPGGTPVKALLADMLYVRAVEMLTLEGDEGVAAVPALLERLEKLEGVNSIDVHHARYMTFRRLGEEEKAERERETIRRIDREYYDLLFAQ